VEEGGVKTFCVDIGKKIREQAGKRRVEMGLIPGFSGQFPEQIAREACAGCGIRGWVGAAPSRHLRELIRNQYGRSLNACGFQRSFFMIVHAQTSLA
jgi:hypothetical protein